MRRRQSSPTSSDGRAPERSARRRRRTRSKAPSEQAIERDCPRAAEHEHHQERDVSKFDGPYEIGNTGDVTCFRGEEGDYHGADQGDGRQPRAEPDQNQRSTYELDPRDEGRL